VLFFFDRSHTDLKYKNNKSKVFKFQNGLCRKKAKINMMHATHNQLIDERNYISRVFLFFLKNKKSE
jgi:hypothetical protein